MKEYVEENIEQEQDALSQDEFAIANEERNEEGDENAAPVIDRDDATVARRLHEISAKKNEWKKRAEEYKRKLEELENKVNTQNDRKGAADDMEQVFKDDVMAIKRAFPYVRINDVRELPDLKTFALLRDAGMDAVSAYRAISSDEIIERALSERTPRTDNRSHLTPIGNQARAKSMDQIPADMLPIWRSAFPKLNERELTALYNKNK